MKKILSISAAVFISIMFVACGAKSDEEKFLQELEALVNEAEGISTQVEAKNFIDVTFEQFCNRAEALYGWEDSGHSWSKIDGSDTPEDVEELSNLKMSVEQVLKLKELNLRLESLEEKLENLAESEDEESVETSADEDDDDDSFSDSDSSSNSEDWDALLKSYEEYVDKYISLLKKANQGDLSALTEYAAMMEKAQDVAEKMENAEDEMSTSQWSRYMKITSKMSQAALEMQ